MTLGLSLGLLVGALFWWSRYAPGGGLFQNPQLLLVPAAIGTVVVGFRNKRKKVGPYDPDTISKNERGRL
jgi:hypothetical protein